MKNFDWDRWVGKNSFNKIWEKTPYLSTIRAIPTCFNDERTLVYLSSVDLDCDVQSIKDLEQILEHIVSAYKTKSSQVKTAQSALKLALYQSDFNVICSLLNDIKITDDYAVFSKDYDYSFPDNLFENLIK